MNIETDDPIRMSSGHRFLECPRWHDGALYASDFIAKQVLRWDGDGEPTVVCEVPAWPGGLGWTPDGKLLVVSMTDRKLLRLEGEETVVVADLGDRATFHCNDMVVDARGRAYIGNFGWDESTDPVIKPAALQRVDPDGSTHVVVEEMICPNGMALSPDSGTLFVNETFAARITAFDVAENGDLSNRRVWAAFSDVEFKTVPEAIESGAILPDGMCLDAEGAIWVGNCRGFGAARVREGGEVVDEVSTAPHASFAVALGGPAGNTLYMCCNLRYGDGNWMELTEGNMRRQDVAVPAPALPS